jgi:hypothetical protein
MRHVPAGWNTVPPLLRANASSAGRRRRVVAGQVLLAGDEAAERRLRVDLAQEPQAGDEHARVVRIGEVAGADPRRRERIGAGELDAAGRFRPALRRRRREAREAMQRIARLVDRERHDVEEHVGAAAARVLGRDQPADLAGADGERPALMEQPLRAHLREAGAGCGRRR